MKFGINRKIIEKIKKIIYSNKKVEEIIIFGSRAYGNYSRNSDIDIALRGKLNFDDLLNLKSKLDEEINIPNKIDILIYNFISNKELKKEIDKKGIKI